MLTRRDIQEIENLETLTNLEELWLGKNKITQLKVRPHRPSPEARSQLNITPQNISPLTNLKILSIQSNRLPTITGLASLASLEELYISHNALTAISGLDHNRNLRVLDVSNNRIPHLAGLQHLSRLEELWASSNELESFREVEGELAGLEELSTVYLEGNPLQTKNVVTYRNKIRLALPRVRQIDASRSRLST